MSGCSLLWSCLRHRAASLLVSKAFDHLLQSSERLVFLSRFSACLHLVPKKSGLACWRLVLFSCEELTLVASLTADSAS